MKRARPIYGFTLLEVLTALAIIALLIGLMLPAVSMVQKSARTVRQKTQFRAIGIALEAFWTDTGDYPPSDYSVTTGAPPSNTGYCGAGKLAEAIVGRDGFGYHPQSHWRSDGQQDMNGDGTGDVPLYSNSTGFGALGQAQQDANFKLRKGTYLELENANAVMLSSLYPGGGGSIFGVLADTLVLCDMFDNVKNITTGKKTGMPILYFKADTNSRLLVPDPLPNPPASFPWNTGTTQSAIYNVNHNYAFYYNIPNGMPSGMFHPMSGDLNLFYNRIKNPNFTNPLRPYRAQSYILLSAGPDGLFGSADDVYNIDESDK